MTESRRSTGGRVVRALYLNVASVDVCYGRATAIQDVSLSVSVGEMAFMIGRNGAGKTTLLKCIAGFLRPSKGEMTFDGKRIDKMTPEQIARTGIRYVAQDKKVFSTLSVRENIELAALGAGCSKEQALETVVSACPVLEKFLQARAGSLSGGQKQLLLTARALVGDPKLVLLDEPTEGLSASAISDIFQLLDSLRGKLSMVIVEQNLAVVERMADTVHVMKEGRLGHRVGRIDAAQLVELEASL